MLSSGGRDGALHLYDTRLRGPEPILSIWGAHTPSLPTNIIKGKGRKSQATALPTGVTEVLWHPHKETNLITSGAKDGVIKLWDLRMMGGFGESMGEGEGRMMFKEKQEALSEIDVNLLGELNRDSMKGSDGGEEVKGVGRGIEGRFLDEFETDKLRELERKLREEEASKNKKGKGKGKGKAKAITATGTNKRKGKEKVEFKVSGTKVGKGKSKGVEGTLDNPFLLDPIEESLDISKSKDGWNKR